MKKEQTAIIVDDEKDAVDLLSNFLEMMGFSVVGRGYNGCEAVRMYEKTNPTFVVLDMKMPMYDGAYAISMIKKMDPDAKIFVITGYSPYDDLEKDVIAVFTKPCDLHQLHDQIKKTLVD